MSLACRNHFEMADYKEWIGRTEIIQDTITTFPVAGLSALLDRDCVIHDGDAVPPLAHWLYFLPLARQSEIDQDGHPKRGGFLPPIDLPRRMWAGGQLTFHAPLRLGTLIERRSSISDIRSKQGKSGALVFVTVTHSIFMSGKLCVTEKQDIVYRAAATMAAPVVPQTPVPQVSSEADLTETIVPDPVQLFRFSALTFNGHRIHFDRDYAKNVENYGGLVIHGPFLAMLLIDLFTRSCPDHEISDFRFKAKKTLLDTGPFAINLKHTEDDFQLWVADGGGETTMEATISVS